MNLQISSRRVLLFLLGVNFFLMLLHIVFHTLDLTLELSPLMKEVVRRFNMDREASVPTWFAQMILFTVALLAGWIGLSKFKLREVFATSWFALCALFVYLSIDEGAEIHELATDPMQNLLEVDSGLLFFSWVVPAMIAVVFVSLVFLRFFLHLPRDTRKLLILAFFCFVGGAVGIEMISGAYWQAQEFQFNFSYRILNMLEEGFENTGTIIAIYALMRYAAADPRVAKKEVVISG